MDTSGYLLFLTIITIASICQNLTGFAFGLILVTLAGALDVMPVAMSANVAMVLALVNAALYLRSTSVNPDWKLLRPILASSIAGLIGGLVLLSWLSASARNGLGILLGIVVVASSLLLVIQSKPRQTMSSPIVMHSASLLSGLMGGLFATPGPPMAYHLYRQPLDQRTIRQCLFVIFAISMLLRLGIVIGSGKFQLEALKLGAMAAPVVALVTYLNARFPPRIPLKGIRWLVASLMAASGITLLMAAMQG